MNYFEKLSLSLILLFLGISSVSAQKILPKISFGLLYADVKTRVQSWDEGNPFRRGAWITLEQNNKLYKWLHLDFGITYQERTPLEALPFARRNSSTETSGIANIVTLGFYPTNPQNDLFHNSTLEYTRFPNFKYLNLEVIPNITLGKTFSVTIGTGLFAGILLNKKNTTVTKEDLPNEKIFFDEGHIHGEVLYHKYDYGWIPKIVLTYQINEKINLGILFKTYQSISRLNDTFIFEQKSLNMRWIAHAGGLSFQYKF